MSARLSPRASRPTSIRSADGGRTGCGPAPAPAPTETVADQVAGSSPSTNETRSRTAKATASAISAGSRGSRIGGRRPHCSISSERRGSASARWASTHRTHAVTPGTTNGPRLTASAPPWTTRWGSARAHSLVEPVPGHDGVADDEQHGRRRAGGGAQPGVVQQAGGGVGKVRGGVQRDRGGRAPVEHAGGPAPVGAEDGRDGGPVGSRGEPGVELGGVDEQVALDERGQHPVGHRRAGRRPDPEAQLLEQPPDLGRVGHDDPVRRVEADLQVPVVAAYDAQPGPQGGPVGETGDGFR